jgi:uncharacterized protein YcbX
MRRKLVGRVRALARYPVKSMLGENLEQLDFTERGAIGDRAYALREVVTGHVASAKKFPKLLEFRAAYDSPPETAVRKAITIVLPDGKKIHAEDPEAAEMISAALGRKMKLERSENVQGEHAGIDPKTVFADVPVDKIFPGVSEIPDHFGLEKASFFDTAVMHVIATGTLKHMAKIAPGSNFDHRRFRPTILVDTGDVDDAFVEDGWEGGTLEVGNGLKIVAMQPALRCVMTTHPQQDLSRDYAVMRTAAFHHKANVGVFASIGASGRVRLGDSVWLDK